VPIPAIVESGVVTLDEDEETPPENLLGGWRWSNEGYNE